VRFAHSSRTDSCSHSSVMRAIRALQSPAYQKARSKNPLLPEVNDRASAENTFKLLPLSLLALRVSKVDPEEHEGHNHAKPKRVKGLWTVKIEQHQEANDDNYYIWLYEGSQFKQKLYAAGALLIVIAVVLFPLWPLFLRQGVWYLSMGMLGLIGLFFAMAIVRLIIFIITMFAAPPGFWLYPNLFEDVGFFDSFRPVWAWQEVCLPNPLHTSPHSNSNAMLTPPRLPRISRPRSKPRRRRRPPSSPQKQMANPARTRRAPRPNTTTTTTTTTNMSTSTITSMNMSTSTSTSPSNLPPSSRHPNLQAPKPRPQQMEK
jgi:protein translocation Sec62 family protein